MAHMWFVATILDSTDVKSSVITGNSTDRAVLGDPMYLNADVHL